MAMGKEPPIFYRRRVANIMCVVIILWSMSLWTVILYEVFEGGIINGTDAPKPLTGFDIVMVVMSMLNVLVGYCVKHLFDTHDN